MWAIFIVSALVVALAAMIIVWIGNKIYLSMKNDNRKFECKNSDNENRGN